MPGQRRSLHGKVASNLRPDPVMEVTKSDALSSDSLLESVEAAGPALVMLVPLLRTLEEFMGQRNFRGGAPLVKLNCHQGLSTLVWSRSTTSDAPFPGPGKHQLLRDNHFAVSANNGVELAIRSSPGLGGSLHALMSL